MRTYCLIAATALVLAACRPEADPTGNAVPADPPPAAETAAPAAARPDPAADAATAAGEVVARLPASLLGAYAADEAGCTSGYGPLVVTPDAFEFGWGAATFLRILREGASYGIEADLVAEGQVVSPERVRYSIALQDDGTGIVFTEGGNVRRYEPCASPSGLSVRYAGQRNGNDAAESPPDNAAEAVDAESPPSREDTPRGVLPLVVGVYVLEGTTCASPANAAIRIYDGQGISGSATRDCRARIRSQQNGSFSVDQSCIDTYDESRTSQAQTIEVADPRRFTLTTADGAERFRLCSPELLPDFLRERMQEQSRES